MVFLKPYCQGKPEVFSEKPVPVPHFNYKSHMVWSGMGNEPPLCKGEN
jgi:hypothetical protein